MEGNPFGPNTPPERPPFGFGPDMGSNNEGGYNRGHNLERGGEERKGENLKNKVSRWISKTGIRGTIIAKISFFIVLLLALILLIIKFKLFALILLVIIFIIFLIKKVPVLRPLFVIMLISVIIFVVTFPFFKIQPTDPVSREMFFSSMKETFSSMMNSWSYIKAEGEMSNAGIDISKRTGDKGNIEIVELSPQLAPLKKNGLPAYTNNTDYITAGIVIEGKGYRTKKIKAKLSCYLEKNNKKVADGEVSLDTFDIYESQNIRKAATCRIPIKGLEPGYYKIKARVDLDSVTFSRNYIPIVNGEVLTSTSYESTQERWNTEGLLEGLEYSDPVDSGGPARVTIDTEDIVVTGGKEYDGWIRIGILTRTSSKDKKIKQILDAKIYVPEGVTILTDKCTGAVKKIGANTYQIENVNSVEPWNSFICPIKIQKSVFRMGKGGITSFDMAYFPLVIEEFGVGIEYIYSVEKKTGVVIV